MARKPKHAAHESHERWLVSYADFITLLFAFFVVMFASSQTDKGKAKQVAESVAKALNENQIASAIAGILGGTVDEKGMGNAMLKGPGGTKTKAAAEQAKQEILSELLPSLQFLSSELKAEIAGGKLQIKMEARGLVVSLLEAAFFPSGEDTTNPKAVEMVEKIAGAVETLPNPVRLEGHTDSTPIHNSRFPSNWELSAARAIAMLRLFSEHCGIPEKRLAAVGYADTVPAASNDTPEGRARNRRVDVVVLNKIGMEVEPSIGPNTASAPQSKGIH